MEFKCMHTTKKRTQTWQGTIELIRTSEGHIEAAITGRGSYLHIITGPQVNGKYICIPNYNVGSELSSYKDFFWNKEQLNRLLGVIDGTTVGTGLTYLPDILETIRSDNPSGN